MSFAHTFLQSCQQMTLVPMKFKPCLKESSIFFHLTNYTGWNVSSSPWPKDWSAIQTTEAKWFAAHHTKRPFIGTVTLTVFWVPKWCSVYRFPGQQQPSPTYISLMLKLWKAIKIYGCRMFNKRCLDLAR